MVRIVFFIIDKFSTEIVLFGLCFIVAGTILIARTQLRGLGVGLRIFGYIVAIPAFVLGDMMFGLMVRKELSFIPSVIGVVVAIIICRLLGKPKNKNTSGTD